MRAFTRSILVPATVGMLITLFAFGALPLPGIHAIGVVTHPNDIFAEIYQNARQSVVAISVTTDEGGGGGSGFVIDRTGHIVTNAHVVDEAEEVIVEFLEGAIVPRSWSAAIRLPISPSSRLMYRRTSWRRSAWRTRTI